jgi:hypothetical protein
MSSKKSKTKNIVGVGHIYTLVCMVKKAGSVEVLCKKPHA